MILFTVTMQDEASAQAPPGTCHSAVG